MERLESYEYHIEHDEEWTKEQLRKDEKDNTELAIIIEFKETNQRLTGKRKLPVGKWEPGKARRGKFYKSIPLFQRRKKTESLRKTTMEQAVVTWI